MWSLPWTNADGGFGSVDCFRRHLGNKFTSRIKASILGGGAMRAGLRFPFRELGIGFARLVTVSTLVSKSTCQTAFSLSRFCYWTTLKALGSTNTQAAFSALRYWLSHCELSMT